LHSTPSGAAGSGREEVRGVDNAQVFAARSEIIQLNRRRLIVIFQTSASSFIS
jgi:hypothetical protein